MKSALVGCGGLPDSPLFNPQSGAMTAAAPDVFQVRFETSEGDFVVEVHKAWAPNGADRFHNLVSNGYYDGVRFFRVIEGFMAQFGIHGDPEVSNRWRNATISDDPVVWSNTRGLGLIRSRGHVPKGGYDVPNGSNHTSAVTPAIQ